ncbi:hypothetical protein ACIQCD_19160 [Streptomyces sp. NPDC093250]|uniref:hypothetical protein n=1 Tax=Streptomyces sp. NPDC093250 TaxID=3366036 RepID=UPI00381A69A1
MTVSRRSILRSAAAVVPAMAIGGALPGVASGATRAAQWQVFPITANSSSWYRFSRISFAPDGSAKALGTDNYLADGPLGPIEQDPLVWSFNGTGWSGAGFAEDTRPLNGITVTNAADAWAVGEKWDAAQRFDVPQLLRWNGAAWTNSMTGAESFARPSQVSGTGSDVWVVGSALESYAIPAVLRRNGSSWAPVRLPSTLGTAALLTVHVMTANDVWVAGSVGTGAARRSLVMRWNGSSWTVLPAPFGTAVGQVTSLLIRGGQCWAGGSAANRSAVAVWNGSAWSARNPASSSVSEVTQLAAYGSTEVWVAGASLALQRWNGSAWSGAEGPQAAPLVVGALATGPDGALWIAGSKETSSSTSYFFAKLPATA